MYPCVHRGQDLTLMNSWRGKSHMVKDEENHHGSAQINHWNHPRRPWLFHQSVTAVILEWERTGMRVLAPWNAIQPKLFSICRPVICLTKTTTYITTLFTAPLGAFTPTLFSSLIQLRIPRRVCASKKWALTCLKQRSRAQFKWTKREELDYSTRHCG